MSVQVGSAVGGVLHQLRQVSMLVRAGTVVTAALLCVLGGRMGGAGDPVRITLASALVACAVGFAQVVNDVADVEVDRLGKPYRPLPSGGLSLRTAAVIAAVLAVGATVAGLVLGSSFVAVALVLLALSWGYSRWWKGTVVFGNLVVAGLSSTPLLIGAAAGGGVTPTVLAAQLLVLLFMLAFEIVKTGLDRDDDASEGLRTIATVAGVRAAAVLGAALLIAFTAATAVPAALGGERPLLFAAIIVPTAAVPALVAGARLLAWGRRPDDLRAPFRLLRWAWWGGVAALAAL